MINRARCADDLSTVGLASNPNQVFWRLHDWDLAWSKSVFLLLLQHNTSRHQLLVRFVGRGSCEASRLLNQTCSIAVIPGAARTTAKHLGTMIHYMGSNQPE
eukprot:10718801-Heterocapsa_arctica.AAC.1